MNVIEVPVEVHRTEDDRVPEIRPTQTSSRNECDSQAPTIDSCSAVSIEARSTAQAPINTIDSTLTAGCMQQMFSQFLLNLQNLFEAQKVTIRAQTQEIISTVDRMLESRLA